MATVEEVLRNAAGDPSTGLIAEVIPLFAKEIEANFEVVPRKKPTPLSPETRVVVAAETRQP